MSRSTRNLLVRMPTLEKLRTTIVFESCTFLGIQKNGNDLRSFRLVQR